MPASTKDQIIQDLSLYPGSSPTAIATRLSLSPAAIRYHLRHMKSEGILATTAQGVHLAERGRPQEFFIIRDPYRPDNFSTVLESLLSIIAEFPSQIQKKIIQSTGKKLADLAEIQTQNRIARLQQSSTYLNEHHYQAFWEARKEFPRFFFKQCPYAALSTWNPLLCELDRAMLQYLSLATVEKVCTIFQKTGCASRCEFNLAYAADVPKQPGSPPNISLDILQ